MKFDNPDIFEKHHVIEVYKHISKHFDSTRFEIWPIIKTFINQFPKYSLIADIGCGNGRNSLYRNDCNFICSDIVPQFVDICTKKNLNCVLANNLYLPFQDNNFDYVLSIAVIHHFCTFNRRLQAIRELIRILKPNGKLLIYVWAKEQKKFENQINNDQFIPWHLQKRFNPNQTNHILQRFYHLFNKGELEHHLSFFHNIKIINNGFQKNNYYAIIQKKN